MLIGCLLIGLSACSPVVIEQRLDVVVSEQQTMNGKHITTYGVVRSYPDPLHYWIEDAELNRVALEPHEMVAEYVGEDVEVTGRFMLNERGGRLLKVRDIRLRDAEPATHR